MTVQSALAAAVAALWLTGCATNTAVQEDVKSTALTQDADKPNIQIKKEGAIPVSQLTGKKVFVSFKNSPKLTDALAARVASAGAQLVARDEADVVLGGEGFFRAARQFGNRQAHADVGEVFEKAGQVETKNKSFTVVLAHGGPLMTAGQATVVSNFFYMVSESTGFRGWFNNLVAGDPDGYCFRGCEYSQAANVTLTVKDKDGNSIGSESATASAENKKLLPMPLIEAALQAVFSGVGPVDEKPATTTAANKYSQGNQ